MQHPNLLQFNLEHILRQNLELKTKTKSLGFGRRLYVWSEQDSYYWLKTQLYGVNSNIEQGFMRELELYSYLNESASSLVLPHQIIELDLALQCEPMLITKNSSVLFNDAQSLSQNEIIEKMIGALDALEKLHGLELIHGDLKKEHFLIESGVTKIIDFEQTHFSDQKPINTALTATPRYMAPELFNGELKSFATDIYALGIIFYEWLISSRIEAGSYYDWAILHCQKLDICLPKQYLVFKPVLEVMLAKQKSKRLCEISLLKSALMTEIV